MPNKQERKIEEKDTYLRKITIPFATTNIFKRQELIRIGGNENILFLDLDIPEIQGTPSEVAEWKAKEAFKANNNQPVIIEETSLDIPSLLILNPAHVKDWTKKPEIRKQLCEILEVMHFERTAKARVILAVFDGIKVEFRAGEKDGRITNQSGNPDFGWDDIFEVETPAGWKTFGEMVPEEKDKYSMRAIALKNLIQNPFTVERL